MMGNTLTLLSDFSKDIGLELVDSISVLECFAAGSIKENETVLHQAEQVGAKMLQQLQD